MESLDRETLREAARRALGSSDRTKALLADGVLTLLLESSPLPAVEGPPDAAPAPTTIIVAGHFSRTLADFERACLTHIGEEQARPSPDNSLVAVLCDAVRLTREHVEALAARVLPVEPAPAQDEAMEHAIKTMAKVELNCPHCGEPATIAESQIRLSLGVAKKGDING